MSGISGPSITKAHAATTKKFIAPKKYNDIWISLAIQFLRQLRSAHDRPQPRAVGMTAYRQKQDCKALAHSQRTRDSSQLSSFRAHWPPDKQLLSTNKPNIVINLSSWHRECDPRHNVLVTDLSSIPVTPHISYRRHVEWLCGHDRMPTVRRTQTKHSSVAKVTLFYAYSMVRLTLDIRSLKYLAKRPQLSRRQLGGI
jgi:hypothetical protein